ncbi:hypothetical protein IL306_004394 [Fusarium sp. DS 682]|nr:hypothetical protein IL306_004394 [Fusarium sp. DS 682]
MAKFNSQENWGKTDWYNQNMTRQDISATSTLQEIACYLGIDSEQSDPHQLLMLAIEKVDKTAVKLIVDNFNVNINQRDVEGRTALTQAVKAGNKEIVDRLLEIEGIDVNAPGEDDITPLWHSLRKYVSIDFLQHHVIREHRMIIAALIQKADVNTPNDNGDYPITWAIRHDIDWVCMNAYVSSQLREPLIPSFLKKDDLDAEAIESHGQSPFLEAVNCQSHSRLDGLLQDLLDSGKFNVNILDEDSRSPLSFAAEKCSSEGIKVLLESSKVEVGSRDKDGRTALIWSIIGNKSANTELLLTNDNSGVDTPDKDGRTPLSWASEKGSLLMVESLLEKPGVNVDKPDHTGLTPLSWAVRRRRAPVQVTPLFGETNSVWGQKKPVFGSLQNTLGGIGTCPESSNEEIVKSLINIGGANPHFKDNNKRTLLSWAVTTKKLGIVKYLVQHPEVDINDPDKDGRTPLSWSAEQEDAEVVRYLLSIDGINVNIEDKENRSPLFWATRPNNAPMIKLFLEKDTEALHTMATKGADVEKLKLLLEAGYVASKLDHRGRTLLHCAVLGKNSGAAKLFIQEYPNSVNEKDKNGITPLQLAVKLSPDMLQLLVESRAVTDEIEQYKWFNGHDGYRQSIVCLSRKGENQSLQFMSQNQFLADFGQYARPIGPGMRLL